MLYRRNPLLLFAIGSIVPSVMMGVTLPVAISLLSFVALFFVMGHQTVLQSIKQFRGSAVAWSFGGFFLFAGISSINGLNPQNSAISLLHLLLILLFSAWLGQYIAESDQRVPRVLHFLLWTMVFMLALAAVHIYVFPGLLRHLPFSNVPDSQYLVMLKKPASSFLLLLPFCGYLLWRSRGVARILPALALFGTVWLIVVVESRSAMAGILAIFATTIILGLLLRRWRGWHIILMSVLLASATGAVVYYLFSIRGGNLGALGIPGWLVETHRQALWNEILLLLYDSFPTSVLWGFGPNALDTLDRGEVLIQHTQNLQKSVARIGYHPHNWALEILVEAGLLGFLFFVGAICGILRWAWQQRQRAAVEVMVLFGVYAAFFSSGLFNYSVWDVWWQISFAVSSAMAWGMVAAGRAKKQGKCSKASETVAREGFL